MDAFDLRLWEGFRNAGGCLEQPAVVDQIVVDSRRISSPRSLFIALPGKQVNGHDFVRQAALANCKYAIVKHDFIANQPETLTLLRVNNPLTALQEIAAAYRAQLQCPLIAIAGSFGKTMVKDLLHSLLSTSKKVFSSPESFNSQIGVALSLLSIQQAHEIAIVEAGISERGEMGRLKSMIRPQGGLITHIGNKHLATLGSIENSAYEIASLFLHSSWTFLPSSMSFTSYLPNPHYCWDEPHTELPHATAFKEKSTYSYLISFPDGTSFKGGITGGFSYFADLLNMAIKVAWKLGVSKNKICSVLENYQLEPTKIEIWTSLNQVTFINHTYSSDPQSIDQALRLLHTSPAKRLFLFGGFKGCPPPDHYLRVAKSIAFSQLDILCLYGDHPFHGLIHEVKVVSPTTMLLQSPTYREALNQLKPYLGPKDTLLIKGAHKEKFDCLLDEFHESTPNNLCTINLAAIEHNIQAIRKKLPCTTRIMVMVKASAYGTNPLRMALTLENSGIDLLGVSFVDEAIDLYQAGAKQDIFVLNATPQESKKVVKWDLEVGVSDLALINSLETCAMEAGKKVKVHLHVDTGMGRFGCRPEEALDLAQRIKNSKHILLEGIFTHFTSSDDPTDDFFTFKQVKVFDDVIQQLDQNHIDVPWKHVANSSATLRLHLPQYNMVRVGLAIYGLYSSKAVQASLDLKLAVSLASRIVGINHCKKGDSVSYGRTYIVEEEEKRIAIIPLGYFDGLHRHYSGKAYVVIHGEKAPMLGKICMDYMMVDITKIPYASVGDPVLIFGEDEYGDFLPPEDLASKGNSIMHELITCLGPRVQRIFIFEESKQHR
ncbi:MAG: alanine racemase [Parachlamydiaceae bacterium]